MRETEPNNSINTEVSNQVQIDTTITDFERRLDWLDLNDPEWSDEVSSGNRYLKTYKNVIHNGFFYLPKESEFLKNIILKITKDYLYFQDVIFSHPKQGIMNLTGPHQFTRTFYGMDIKKSPLLVSQQDIDWIYYSKFGEFISPLKTIKHYSILKDLKTIDSKKSLNLM